MRPEEMFCLIGSEDSNANNTHERISRWENEGLKLEAVFERDDAVALVVVYEMYALKRDHISILPVYTACLTGLSRIITVINLAAVIKAVAVRIRIIVIGAVKLF